MEKQQPFSLKQISSEDWENTPQDVKSLVESLLASAALLESQSRLIQFLDATPIAIAVHDSTGQLVYINHLAQALLGIDRPLELSPDQLSKVFQIYREGTEALYPLEALPSNRSLAGETIWVDDLEIHRGDRVIPLEVWATPIFGDRGEVTYAIVAFQDISDRKRQHLEQQIVENTLVKSERRYRQVIEVQTDLILRSLPDTTITFANDSLCLALGQSLENVIGWRWSNFVPPEDLNELSRKIAALTPKNPIFENINQDYRSNNQIGWTQWINLGIFDEHGQLTEIQSVGRDITALQEQIQREQALNRVFQSIRNSLDLDTIFATATAETAKLLKTLDCFVVQYLPEQGIWKHIAEFRHNPDAPTVIGFEIPDVGNPFAAQLKQLQIVRVENTTNLDNQINYEVAQIIPGAWLLIPLVIEDTLWGSFTIISPQQAFTWSDNQIKLVQSVADQLEIAIHQANLYQQIQLELTERRRVEMALRESEARFQNMAANVPGAIFRYLIRPDGSDSVVYMSQGCYRLWEVETQDVVTDATILWQMIHSEDVAGMQASLMESAQTLQPWYWAWRITTPSGREKWLEAAGRPTRQANADIIWDTLILDVTERQAALRERKQAEYRFQTLAANTPGVIYQYVLHPDGSNAMLYVSPGCRYLWELEPQDIERDVEVTWRMVHPDDLPAMRDSVLVSAETLYPWNWEWRVTTPSGRQKWLQASARPQRQANGDIIWDGLILDVSERQAALRERKQAEEAMRESEARYRLLAENTNDLVCLHELNGRYLYVSPSCEFLLGYRHDEMLREDIHTFIHPDDRDRVYQEIRTAVFRKKLTPITYRMLQKRGNYVWFETLTKPILDATGEIVQLQTTSRDVTERIQVQNQLKHDALHDGLTGLPNRHFFMKRLELAIQRAYRLENYHFAVLFLDLDRFKVVNDSLGHLVGDQLLIAIAEKLQATIRTMDLAARLGGDEFAILLEEIKDIQEAVRIAERIFAELQTPMMIEGREVYTTSSVGIVLGTKDYVQASHLLRDADIAMYRAKNKGKARYEIFDTEMHTQALNRLHLENDLRRAIKCQEFVLHYQPIVALDTRHLVGFEALIRWQHPTQGLKFPGEFIPIAEEIGLITLLDYWAIRTACYQMAAWQTAFPELSAMRVSVNLSAQDIKQSDLLEEVDRILTQTQLNGRYLTLEITESMLIEDIESTITVLGQLKERGIQISIDDFGTGYSSLNYLHRLPVDSLKVDRSFVNQIQSGKKNHQIVETIVALSNHLELDAIAEGIETQEQLEHLQHLGYKFGQGYLFSKPMSHHTTEALLASKSLYYNLWS